MTIRDMFFACDNIADTAQIYVYFKFGAYLERGWADLYTTFDDMAEAVKELNVRKFKVHRSGNAVYVYVK